MAAATSSRAEGAPSVRPGALTALLADLARAPEAGGWDLPVAPGETIGRFELGRELGRGGFGVVYEARDVELGRSVAFKAVRSGASDAVREQRALAEAEAAARLAHPNIVHLYDVGRCDRGPFLIMELLRGETLDERLGRGPLPVREAVRIAAEIARGVAHAHVQGVLHRDLKPGNVFVCDDGQVKVLDFGLAHVFGKGGIAGGTPAYMAPEQAAGEVGDERADVYALGVIAHELVAGRRPFADGEPGVGAGGRAPELRAPAPLAKLVARMLARDPTARPASAVEVQAQLAAIQKSMEPKRLLWAAWAVAAAALLAAGALALRAHPLPPGRLLVAMADAENTTGERDLDDASELLGTALEQSRRLSLVARSRMVSLLRALGGGTVPRIDEAAARSAARRVEARALIVPAVRRASVGFDVEARAVDVARGETLFTLRERAGGKSGLPAAIDRLSERIRGALDEEPRQAPERRVLVAQLAPSSPAALAAYAEGKRLESEGRGDEARKAYERALEADPEFPLAHAELVKHFLWVDDVTAERHLDAALRGADRLPPKEKLLLEASRAKVHYRIEEALEKWDRAIAGWPQDPAAYAEAGFMLLRFYGETDAARSYLEKGVELAGLERPQRVDALVALGRLDEALDVAQRWAAESGTPMAIGNLSVVHRLRGERDAALQQARRLVSLGFIPGTRMPGKRRAANVFWTYVDADAVDEIEEVFARAGLRSWDLLALRGRLREALRTYDADSPSGEGAARRPGAPRNLEAIFHGVRGALVWGLGDAEAVWREVEAQLRAGSSAAMCSSHGLCALGDVERAARLAALWAPVAEPRMYCLRLYRHLREWREGHAEDAARGLAGMYGPEPAYWFGVVLGELRRDREAVEAFRRFRRDPVWNADGFNLVAYPRSLYLEAAALERLGERDEASRTIERLFRIWNRPEPDLPYLREARALRARLAAGAR